MNSGYVEAREWCVICGISWQRGVVAFKFRRTPKGEYVCLNEDNCDRRSVNRHGLRSLDDRMVYNGA